MPENSLPAFEAAVRAGYGVELDVMLTLDSEVVVVHDATLERSTGQPGMVGQLPLASLRTFRLLGTDHAIPTLVEALAVLGDTPTMIEVKQPRFRVGRAEAAIAEVVAAHDGPACVAGFNPGTLRWFRRHQPQTPRVLTAGPLDDVALPRPIRRRLAALRDLAGTDPAAVSYELRGLPTPATTRWRDRGGVLVTWTVEDEDGLARARDLADNVIFEHVRP